MRIVYAWLIAGMISARSLIAAEPTASVKVGGAFLGLTNLFTHEEAQTTQPKERQFDFAANIDLAWKYGERLSGEVQLQSGPGNGSIGFEGPEPVVTDLSATYHIPRYALSLTAGSFDIPFGAQTGSLSNNADTFGNPFFLNSLFYSAFAGTPAGTLNNLGIMAEHHSKRGEIALAITNGADETAANPDGGFGIAARIGYQAPIARGLRLTTSGIHSQNRSPSGVSGPEVDLTGVLGETEFSLGGDNYLKGYAGHLIWDDGEAATEDALTVWMIETRFGPGPWYAAVRASGWRPKDDDRSGDGISTGLPVAGMGRTAIADQQVIRYQVGGGFIPQEGMVAKLELLFDNYAEPSMNVVGLLFGVNIAF